VSAKQPRPWSLLTLVLAAGLALAAVLYGVAVGRALSHDGCCLVYQTENFYGWPFSQHMAFGITIYSALVYCLVCAAVTLRLNRLAALVCLAIAIPIVINDDAGGLFDFFSALPWTPVRGPAFENFYNITRFPDKAWYGVLLILLASAIYCIAGIVAERRSRVAQVQG